MLTTLTFEAQEFSIPSRAARPFEGCAITYAGGNGNYGHSDQAAYHTGQRTFHAGADYYDTRFGERRAMGEQAVNSGDSDVIDMLNFVAHHFGGDYRFFGYRDVAGSGGDDHDHALAALLILAIALEHDGASQGTKFGAVHGGGYRGVLFGGRSGREHVAALSGQAAEDLRYLPWRFALSKNYLGHALAQGAMVVDLGKTQVLKGQVAQPLDGLVGRDALFPDLIEQLTEGLGVHTMQTSLYVAPGGAGSSQFPVAGSQ
jgi:hypothetical protein